MKNSVNLFTLLITTLFLTSCINGKPGPVPRGYASYDEKYKSAPGEQAEDVGYRFSMQDNETVLKDMRFAAQDLAERLDEHLAFDTDEIYLHAPPENVFYKSFDYLLRAELINRGYRFSSVPEGKTNIHLGVLDNVTQCAIVPVIANEGVSSYKTAFVQLAIEQGTESFGTISGFYELPLYGYQPDNSFQLIIPDCEEEHVFDKVEKLDAVEALELAP